MHQGDLIRMTAAILNEYIKRIKNIRNANKLIKQESANKKKNCIFMEGKIYKSPNVPLSNSVSMRMQAQGNESHRC